MTIEAQSGPGAERRTAYLISLETAGENARRVRVALEYAIEQAPNQKERDSLKQAKAYVTGIQLLARHTIDRYRPLRTEKGLP